MYFNSINLTLISKISIRNDTFYDTNHIKTVLIPLKISVL